MTGVAVIGTGFGCYTHVRALRASGFEVLALVGRDPAKTAERARLFDVPRASSSLRDALADCREFQRLEEAGYQNELRARYSPLRRYLPAFLELPFQAEPGAEPLLRGIQLLREMNQGSSPTWPENVPITGIAGGLAASVEKGGWHH